jgi:hypothetical protein
VAKEQVEEANMSDLSEFKYYTVTATASVAVQGREDMPENQRQFQAIETARLASIPHSACEWTVESKKEAPRRDCMEARKKGSNDPFLAVLWTSEDGTCVMIRSTLGKYELLNMSDLEVRDCV